MKKYQIEVQWHYRAFDYASVEIEAESLEAAKEQALIMEKSGQITDWSDGQIYDGAAEINDEECHEVAS